MNKLVKRNTIIATAIGVPSAALLATAIAVPLCSAQPAANTPKVEQTAPILAEDNFTYEKLQGHYESVEEEVTEDTTPFQYTKMMPTQASIDAMNKKKATIAAERTYLDAYRKYQQEEAINAANKATYDSWMNGKAGSYTDSIPYQYEKMQGNYTDEDVVDKTASGYKFDSYEKITPVYQDLQMTEGVFNDWMNGKAGSYTDSIPYQYEKMQASYDKVVDKTASGYDFDSYEKISAEYQDLQMTEGLFNDWMNGKAGYYEDFASRVKADNEYVTPFDEAAYMKILTNAMAAEAEATKQKEITISAEVEKKAQITIEEILTQFANADAVRGQELTNKYLKYEKAVKARVVDLLKPYIEGKQQTKCGIDELRKLSNTLSKSLK